MEKDNIIDFLDNLISNCSEWLRFSEAKNAALVAYAGALLSLMLGSDPVEAGWFPKTLLILGGGLTLIGLLISLFSFNPNENTKPKSFSSPHITLDTLNIFAWPDLAECDTAIVSEYLKKRVINSENISETDLSLYKKQIDQAIILAQITKQKDRLFKCALKFCLAGTLLSVVMILIIRVF